MSLSTVKTFRNPYPGIRSFEINESSLFFGREKQTTELVDILLKQRFITITGSSGSGKSSLVKAGLIPELLSKGDNWIFTVFRPGSSPIRNFANNFSQTLRNNLFEKNKNSNANNIERNIRESFENYLDLLSKLNTDKNIFIYVDQFEEIFRFKQNDTIKGSETEANMFVKFLIFLSQQRKHNIYLALSLRSDFLGDCTQFAGLADMINQGHYLIPKMTEDEKELAITGPISISKGEISENLLTRIKDDVKQHNTTLPVLQHALMKTWEYQFATDNVNKALDIEHYEAVGTVANALSVHAEQIFGSLQDEQKKNITKKIFKTLTELGEDNRGTRRPTRFDKICEITKARKEEVLEVIDLFRAENSSFLTPSINVSISSETIIDISHESIMYVWIRLKEWVREETESAQLYLRLSTSALLFQEGKTGLLQSPDLQLALKWKEETRPNEEWAIRYNPAFERTISYLDFSKKEYDKEIELNLEKQKKNLKRARFIAFFLGTASLISIMFLVIAMNLKFKAEASEKEALVKERLAVKISKVAEQKKKEAVSHKRVAEQQQLIAEQQRLFAEEQKQYAIDQKKEAIIQKQLAFIAKNDAIIARDDAKKSQKLAEILRDEAYEQRTLAEQQQQRAELSEAKTDTLRRIAIAKSLAIQAIRQGETNKKKQSISEYEQKLPAILALQSYYFNKKYGGNKYDSDIFSALSYISDSKITIRGEDAHTEGVRSLAVCPSENSFISCSDDGTIKMFSFDQNKKTITFNTEGHGENGFRSVITINNTSKIVAGAVNGEILICNIKTPTEKPIILKIHNDIVNNLIYSPANNRVISSSYDGSIYMIDVETINNPPKRILKSDNKITAIQTNLDETKLYVANSKGDFFVINLSNYSDIINIPTSENIITSIQVTGKNEVVAGTNNGKMLIIKDYKIINNLYAHNSKISEFAFDTNNKRLISCSFDKKIKIWNYSDFNEEPIILDNHSAWIYSITLSADNTRLISGSENKSIVISEIDITNLKNIIQKDITENMTHKDWIKYIGEGIIYEEKIPND